MLSFFLSSFCLSFVRGQLVKITFRNATTGVCCPAFILTSVVRMHSQCSVVAKRRRIYYACMGKIVNRVTELHLKHAYFPRIDSQIDSLKEILFCKKVERWFDVSQNSERQRACAWRADLQIEPVINTQ